MIENSLAIFCRERGNDITAKSRKERPRLLPVPHPIQEAEPVLQWRVGMDHVVNGGDVAAMVEPEGDLELKSFLRRNSFSAIIFLPEMICFS